MEKHALSRFDLLCLGSNAIIGSGIYFIPSVLAGLLGPASVCALLLCGLLSGLIARCFAELAPRYPRSGGPYLYALAAFGRLPGFAIGWACWAAAAISWAAVNRGLVAQLAHLWPALDRALPAALVGGGLALLLGGINYIGLRLGAVTMKVLTIAKLTPLLALAVAGLWQLFFKGAYRALLPFTPLGWRGLPRGTFLAFFAYQGFEVIPVPASESAAPQRDVPWTTFASLALATLLYAVIQLTAVVADPHIAQTSRPLTVLADALGWPAGATFTAIAGSLSMLGFCAGVALCSPRYLEALAHDGFLPQGLAERHSRFATPHAAIAVTTLCAATLSVALPFWRLVDLSVLTVGLQYLGATAALPILRRQAAGWGTARDDILAGSASVIVLVLMLGQLTARHTRSTLIAFFATLLVGAVAWFASRRIAR